MTKRIKFLDRNFLQITVKTPTELIKKPATFTNAILKW